VKVSIRRLDLPVDRPRPRAVVPRLRVDLCPADSDGALRCPYCHADVEDHPLSVVCEACDALHHRACWLARGCGSCGTEGDVVPAPGVQARQRWGRPRARDGWVFLLAVLLLALGPALHWASASRGRASAATETAGRLTWEPAPKPRPLLDVARDDPYAELAATDLIDPVRAREAHAVVRARFEHGVGLTLGVERVLKGPSGFATRPLPETLWVDIAAYGDTIQAGYATFYLALDPRVCDHCPQRWVLISLDPCYSMTHQVARDVDLPDQARPESYPGGCR
jgi:hypothetical protein